MALNIWTLPNAITVLRILACPVCLFLLTSPSSTAIWLALLLMLACEFSDFLDGHIARAYQQVSSVGKILDPMADSLYHVCIFVAFVELGWMPLWALLIIASRDIAVSYLRLLAEQSTGTLAARRSGKLKTAAYSVAQIGAVALFAILGPAGFASILPFVSALLLGLTALAAYTLVEYSLVVLRRLA